jgi:hypothetical protein
MKSKKKLYFKNYLWYFSPTKKIKLYLFIFKKGLFGASHCHKSNFLLPIQHPAMSFLPCFQMIVGWKKYKIYNVFDPNVHIPKCNPQQFWCLFSKKKNFMFNLTLLVFQPSLFNTLTITSCCSLLIFSSFVILSIVWCIFVVNQT